MARTKYPPTIERARTICRAMPGVEERSSWGFPTFRVGAKKGKGGKIFAAAGIRYRGAHIAFKSMDDSIIEDDRVIPIHMFGSWKRFEDWYFYFFDDERKDDWTTLKQFLEVSWELHFAQLPQKEQDRILPPKKPAKPARKKRR